MSHPATIDHQAVHINLTKHGTKTVDVVTAQPGSAQSPSVQYDAPTAMAIFTQSPTPVVAQKPDPKLKPKDFVMTSCFVIFACNFIFGLLGYHFGGKSIETSKLFLNVILCSFALLQKYVNPNAGV